MRKGVDMECEKSEKILILENQIRSLKKLKKLDGEYIIGLASRISELEKMKSYALHDTEFNILQQQRIKALEERMGELESHNHSFIASLPLLCKSQPKSKKPTCGDCKHPFWRGVEGRCWVSGTGISSNWCNTYRTNVTCSSFELVEGS